MKRSGILLGALLFLAVLLATFSWWRGRQLTPPVPAPDLTQLEKGARERIAAERLASMRVTGSFTASAERKAAEWGSLGEIYLAYRFAPAAAACFRNASTLAPSEFRWYYLNAEALNEDGQVAKAANAMAHAVDAMQRDPESRWADRIAALCLLGDAAVHLNRPADARRTFEAVLELKADQPFALYRLGQLSSREGNHADAVGCFEKALRSLPGRAEILTSLAAEYRILGNGAHADRIVPRPDSLRKADPISWPDPIRESVAEMNLSGARQERLANDALSRGLWRSGAAHWADAVEADPNNAFRHASYGRTLLALDRIEEARDELAKARRLDPVTEEIRASELLALSSSPAMADQAIKLASAWRKERPDSFPALQSQADVEFRTGHFAEALEALKEVAAWKPSETGWRLDRARALSALGRYAEARRDLATTLAASPDDSHVKLDYARLLACSPSAATDDGLQAVHLSREMLASGRTLVRMESLAVALARAGQFGEAAVLAGNALRFAGDNEQPALNRRLDAELKAIQAHQPCSERWPFEDRK